MTFSFAGLGPWTDHDGRWCCGLYCDKPCPYGLRLKPKRQAAADRHPMTPDADRPAESLSDVPSGTLAKPHTD